MGYQLPEKLKNLQPYDPVTASYRVRLDANESFLSLPDSLRKELAEAVAGLDLNRYPDPTAARLRGKAASFWDVPMQALTVGNGSDELIGLIVSSFLAPGESMVVALPDFSMYEFYAQMNGVRVYDAMKLAGKNGEDALVLSADDMIRAVRETKAGLLIFSNPCNPTSLGLSKTEVRKIIEQLPDVLIVADEAYMEFAEDASVLREAAKSDHVIVLKTCSKAFGMAGIRLGFAISGPVLSRVLQAVKSPYNVNSMTQAAGCVLFDHPQYLRECIGKIRAARDELYQGILRLRAEKTEIKSVQPTVTNFVFLRTKRPAEICGALKERSISVRYLNGYLRISAGSKAENEAVLQALREILR